MNVRNYTISIPVLLLAAFAAGCGSEGPKTAKADEGPVLPVHTVPVVHASSADYYEASGTVRARSSAQVSSRVMAYVREVRVHVGDHVRAGQPLVILDARDLESKRRQAEAGHTEALSAASESENAIAAARANLHLAEVTFGRMQDLYNKKSLADQEFDEAKTRVAVARANLDMAQSRRQQVAAKIAQAGEEMNAADIVGSYSVIKAPLAGVVTEKMVEPGNVATPGTPLLTVEQGGAYRLEVAVEESNLAKVRVGQTVPVQLDANADELQGRVSEIVPAVDPAARSFTVKIDLPATSQLRSGQFGRARFPMGERMAVTIPANAIQEKGQVQWVYTVEGGRARSRMVSLGDRHKATVEVLSGVGESDRIIAPVGTGIRDGVRVEVRQ